MTAPLVVRPGRYRQFGSAGRPFYLVTSAELAGAFTIDGAGEVISLEPGRGLAPVLASRTCETADVLVAAPGIFLGPLTPQEVGGRQLALLPCGSTPVTLGQLAAVLPVLERTDPGDQERRAGQFFTAVEESEQLTVTDRATGTECVLDPHDGPGEWHQQAGPLAPGEQQIAPAGELSLLAGGIAGFDPQARVAMSGELTLRGPVIVHAGYDPGLLPEQERLYGRLAGLATEPVVLEVADGLIVSCRPGTNAAEAASAAAVLAELLAADPNYRIIWEVGFGINTELQPLPGNCGLNEVFGGRSGVLHLGLGLTPGTRFALTFLCPGSSVATDTGRRLAGGTGRSVRRIKSASCGCH